VSCVNGFGRRRTAAADETRLYRLGAFTFVDELETRCARLTAMPHAYPLVPRHENSGARRVPHGNYLIFYRVLADVVEILHVLHGARDYEPIVFPSSTKK